MIIESDRTPTCSTTDPEIFFPKMPHDRQQLDNIAAAKEMCNRCPVFNECLDYAMRHAVDGIWAGTTLPERKAKRKELGIVIDNDLTNLCKRGHVKAGHNAYISKSGHKKCRKCNAMDKAEKIERDSQ